MHHKNTHQKLLQHHMQYAYLTNKSTAILIAMRLLKKYCNMLQYLQYQYWNTSLSTQKIDNYNTSRSAKIYFCLVFVIAVTDILQCPPESHLGRVRRYPSWQRMLSCAACASCTMSTADKSSYSAAGTLYPYHISPLTYRSLTIAFTLTLTLLAILIPLQLPASILQPWM